MHSNCSTRKCSVSTLWHILLLSVLGISGLWAQVTATISGTVTDSSGATVANATIEVKNAGTAVTQTTTTDAQGRYAVRELPIGDYEVHATATGFQNVVRTGITLEVGAQSVVDFALTVGQTQETVVVQSQVSEVETNSTSVGSVVEPTQMRELPLNGRNFESLLDLVPG